MSPATTLFIDVGGVLATNSWDRNLRKKAVEFFGLEADAFEERHLLTFDTLEEGKLTLDEYLSRVVFHAPRSFTPAEFKEFMFSHSQPYPEMIELVRKLKAAYRLKIAILSNDGRELSTHRIEKLGLNTFVDFFIVSCFVHFRKPDADLFRLALDIAQVPPSHAIYVEDRIMFVEVAKTLGITSIHHTGFESTRKALEELGFTLHSQKEAA